MLPSLELLQAKLYETPDEPFVGGTGNSALNILPFETNEAAATTPSAKSIPASMLSKPSNSQRMDLLDTPMIQAIQGEQASKQVRGGGHQGIQMLNPHDTYKSMKADFYTRSMLDFVNASGSSTGVPYTENQLLNAYLTSVYMNAAVNRVANLISKIKIYAEVFDDNKWQKAPSELLINKIFEKKSGHVLSRMWLNYAIYGATLVYKMPTQLAVTSRSKGESIYNYSEGAVSDLVVLDKPMWSIDETGNYGEIKGAFINQNTGGLDFFPIDESYLDRKQFVYTTSWNPNDANRGVPLVAVAIHEAVANSAIAQWMAEYFTRGAMPFIMVSMDEDPALITDADLQKYKREFEEYWQGLNSSLRSVFFDRKVAVEQVGIAASDIAAPDLNATALEGIATVIGLDHKLIVTTDGGSYNEHSQLVKRALRDTVIPRAQEFIAALQLDLGLPPNMKLALDLSDLDELNADRDERSSTEIAIFDATLQTYGETRSKLEMSSEPVEAIASWYKYEDRFMPIERIAETRDVPTNALVEYAMRLYDNNLIRKSDVLTKLNLPVPSQLIDGYKNEVEELFNNITNLWESDLMTRHQVLTMLGYSVPEEIEDGYKSELERGADFGEWVTSLYADNLLTRSQAIELLDMDIKIPDNFVDGYADDLSSWKSDLMDLWSNNLAKRRYIMERFGIEDDDVTDGFQDDIENGYDRLREEEQLEYDRYIADIERRWQQYSDRAALVTDLYDGNFLRREQVLEELGIPYQPNTPLDYKVVSDAILETAADQETERLKQQAELQEQEAANSLANEDATDFAGTATRRFVSGTRDNRTANNRLSFRAADQDYDDILKLLEDDIATQTGSALPATETRLREFNTIKQNTNARLKLAIIDNWRDLVALENDDAPIVTDEQINSVASLLVEKTKARQATLAKEIAAWRRAALKSIAKGIAFETNLVSEEVDKKIRQQLRQLEIDQPQDTKSAIAAIFSKAQ